MPVLSEANDQDGLGSSNKRYSLQQGQGDDNPGGGRGSNDDLHDKNNWGRGTGDHNKSNNDMV